MSVSRRGSSFTSISRQQRKKNGNRKATAVAARLPPEKIAPARQPGGMIARLAPGPESIDLMVPETIAARLSMMISVPSEAMSFTGSMEVCARDAAAAARATFCISGMGASMAALEELRGRRRPSHSAARQQKR